MPSFSPGQFMNTYDARHLQLLNLIESCQWDALTENDLDELKVLLVCRYVSLGQAQSDTRIMITSEGRHYHRHLASLATRFGESPDGGYRTTLPNQGNEAFRLA